MKTAVVFPGQGAQYFGMGKDFYETFDVSRKILEEASDTLKMDICKLCFEENDKLNITEYTQPAMFTVCVAMYEAFREIGLETKLTAGLSLGEYAALYVAGAYDFGEALQCVGKRGLYMQEAVPPGQGAMSAVLGLDIRSIEEICAQTEGKVTIANYNCPGQTVISGASAKVREVSEALMQAGALKVVPLNVSGPFHSPMLREAGEKLRSELGQIHWRPLQIPYVANRNARLIEDKEVIPDILVEQISSPVLWQQSVETMLAQGVEKFIEIGPGNTLKKFIRKITKDVLVENIETVEDLMRYGE
ncbi:MAG: ACP S-malonyltransferase [Roseburia sp.]|nr:ACP S-malonyltransferase [Roseburia sp.]